jgi:hypothetical protein
MLCHLGICQLSEPVAVSESVCFPLVVAVMCSGQSEPHEALRVHLQADGQAKGTQATPLRLQQAGNGKCTITAMITVWPHVDGGVLVRH